MRPTGIYHNVGTGTRRRSARLLPCIVALGLSAAIAGCIIGEAPGTVVWGINESNQDVIVASSHHGKSLMLPAHTWGKLFDNYSPPSGDLSVFDAGCRALATLPLTRSSDTIHIGPADEIEMTGSGDIHAPSSVKRARDNPTGDGDFFAEASCP